MDLPHCPSGRTDCLFELGQSTLSSGRSRRLMNRAGEVTTVVERPMTRTEAVRCETCGQAFIGEAAVDQALAWRPVDGFRVFHTIIEETKAP